ncbi:protein CutA, chloroplastic [Cinnamomum micranthum f. kanehirae]|uniref:Protein CutA, chloroplastic n=1 Tax=Cinnamomum micranthum f. kanehirae TaxID=337451 RepID=A0A443NLF8_9MAGN|nr:protein CutA, chloroplastic [Cinnamomum micranthum f. kanehirae]
MAFPICSSSSSRAFFSRASFPLSSFGIRLPLVGAFCVLSLGLTNLSPALTFKTGCTQSHSFLPFLTSKFTGQSYPKASHSTGMESSTSTVPSIVVYVTVPNKEAGKKLADSIVREKLAACVNIIQTDSEELLIIKTRESLLEALTEHVKSNHEYEVPEVIAMPITGGNLKYLEWIKNSTRD